MWFLPQCMTNYTNVQELDKATVMVMVDCIGEHLGSVTHEKAGKVYWVIIYLMGYSGQKLLD